MTAPPPTFQKPSPTRIKEPIFAVENSTVINCVAHTVNTYNNIRAERGHLARITIMKITSVVAFEDSVLFNVDATVPAYKADENGKMVQTEDTKFSMNYPDLARQAYPLNADIAELRSLRGQHLSGEDWIKLLTGAKIAVDFTFVKAGDTVGEHTYENTGYIKTLKKLELDERVASRLDRALSF